MPVSFNRTICCDLNETISREWLVTNGIGAYAAGTVAGVLTRLQHGLLVVPDKQSGKPQLLLAKIDEEVQFDDRTFYLGTNEYRDGTLSPSGFVHLEHFHLEEGFPVFVYRIGGLDGMLLEKRVWMPQGQNTTYIQYRAFQTPVSHDLATRNPHHLSSGNPFFKETEKREIILTLLPLTAQRPYDQPQYGHPDWQFQMSTYQSSFEEQRSAIGPDTNFSSGTVGCTLQVRKGDPCFHLLAVGVSHNQVRFLPTGVWYWHFLRRQDQKEHGPVMDDLYLPGVIRAHLQPDEDSTLTIVITTENIHEQILNNTQINHSYKKAVEEQRNRIQPKRYFGEGDPTSHDLQALALMGTENPQAEGEDFLKCLLQAADRLIIQRPMITRDWLTTLSKPENQVSILSNYYNQKEQTREILIALPGLLLATQRYEEANQILRNVARHFKQGLLPDRLPSAGRVLEDQDYYNADVTLWYLYALGYYLRITRDYEFLENLLPRLHEQIGYYIQGSRHGIKVDPQDGLLQTDAPQLALTWMNAHTSKGPVTPRSGKPVEINALWYHGLNLMHQWTEHFAYRGNLYRPPFDYQKLKQQCLESFERRFWYEQGQYLYDVIDGPEGNDHSFRPNQLLALSLSHPLIIDRQKWNSILEQIRDRLLTPYGLRSLDQSDPHYHGHGGRNLEEKALALHQGCIWTWFIGPYIDTVFQNKQRNYDIQEEGNPQENPWNLSFQLLTGIRPQLEKDLLGSINGIYTGEPPMHQIETESSASTIGELLRIYKLLTETDIGQIKRTVGLAG